MSDYYDMGDHSWPISTDSPEAQIWFDRGLNWTYGFNHEEAIKCFQKVLEHDPTCPMAYWGIAYADGPNYNKQWYKFSDEDLVLTLARVYDATEKAVALLEHANPTEQALIKALQTRYPQRAPAEDCHPWNHDYADAMRFVYRANSDHLDITALFVEALMNLTPWQMWDLQTGEIAEGASTAEAMEVLESALERKECRKHPGILHMYVHLIEMSPHPEKALRAGDWLRGLVPDSGHLNHMPTHLDVLCGNYYDVVAWNEEAIKANRKFFERDGGMTYYTLYMTHDFHFKMYGAMFLGQYEAAMEAAEEMIERIPDELLRVEVPPMIDYLEGWLPMKMHVLIRFGKWQEIIDTPLPEDQEFFCVTTAMIHYAKTVALAATGRVDEAEREKTLFEAAVTRVPDTRRLQENLCIDILEIAREMLYGELEYRKGNYDEAFAHLRKSVELDDNLPYQEPWAWMQPTRHALGALLLEQGRVEEAEEVYRADLGLDDTLPRACQHPENVWALHGYHECLVRLGKHDLAEMVKPRLDLAAARADVPIKASCYCRMSAVA